MVKDERGRYNLNQHFLPEFIGDLSDGYHSFKELYEQRHTLFIAFCRFIDSVDRVEWGLEQPEVWRSATHSDGSSWRGWFIMGIGKEPGQQITYHLPVSKWDETDFAETLEKAPEWDGHSSEDVLERLRNI